MSTALSERQMTAWRALVMASEMLQQGLDRQLQRDAGMPHAYFAILAALSYAPGNTLVMGDLADALGYSSSRLSHAISRMEQSGWAGRSPCPTSRRETLVTLTSAGRQALRTAAPSQAQFARSAVFDQLSEAEVEQLTTICRRIARTLAASHRDPGLIERALGGEKRQAPPEHG